MQDEIILPDSDTIEKLAEEYRKIKPKRLVGEVSVLSRTSRVKIIEKPIDERRIEELALTLADSYQRSFVLLKKMIANTQNVVSRQRLKELLAKRESALNCLSKLGLYGQNTVFACKSEMISSTTRVRFNNVLLEESDCYEELVDALPKGAKRAAVVALKKENFRQTVCYLLALS